MSNIPTKRQLVLGMSCCAAGMGDIADDLDIIEAFVSLLPDVSSKFKAQLFEYYQQMPRALLLHLYVIPFGFFIGALDRYVFVVEQQRAAQKLSRPLFPTVPLAFTMISNYLLCTTFADPVNQKQCNDTAVDILANTGVGFAKQALHDIAKWEPFPWQDLRWPGCWR